MELSPKQQIVELITKSKNILILTHVNPDGDALGSTLALYLALKKIGKAVMGFCVDPKPAVFSYLPQFEAIKSELHSQQDFIISLDTNKAKIDRLGYKNLPEENKLNIIISASSGKFTQEDVTVSYGGHRFDLIFVLDSPDLERVGKVYDELTDLFYEIPIINIDHHPGNDYFGKVNWVDLTATSTCEIMVALLESLGRETNLIDANIATCLLTGLITDTGSFQHNNTTPKSFTIAAQLVAAGAKQQEIIQNIYKTKLLSTLKLWGKVLSNIREEKNYSFVYSTVSASDFSAYQAEESEVSGVIDELLKTAIGIDFALLLSERKDGLHGSLRGARAGVNVAEIAKMFGGGGHELAAAFNIPQTTLLESEGEVIDKIRAWQAKKKNLESGSLVNNSEIESLGNE